MDRREFIGRFLKRAGIGVGAGAAVTAGLVGYYQPRRELYSSGPRSADASQTMPEGKRCVVIGGGLAGISAALELAKKGACVTLVESSGALGGKLTGWEIEALGEQMPVEHGFHGFFDQYYNLNEMFASAGITDDVLMLLLAIRCSSGSGRRRLTAKRQKCFLSTYSPSSVSPVLLILHRFSGSTGVSCRL